MIFDFLNASYCTTNENQHIKEDTIIESKINSSYQQIYYETFHCFPCTYKNCTNGPTVHTWLLAQLNIFILL